MRGLKVLHLQLKSTKLRTEVWILNLQIEDGGLDFKSTKLRTEVWILNLQN